MNGNTIINISSITLKLWLLLIGASPTLLAQDNPWSIGLQAGPTFAFATRISANPFVERFRVEPTRGYTGGVVMQYLTENNFGFQTEINYVQKGWEELPRDSITGERDPERFYRVNLDYVEVPVLAHGYLGRRNLRIFLNVGFSLSYLLSYRTDRAEVANGDITVIYQEIHQNKFDFGIRGGGGFKVVTKVGMFQLEGSFTRGLNSVMDKNINSIANIVQNNTVAVTLGYFVQF